MKKSSSSFSDFARGAANVSGSSTTFALAVLIVIVWAASGPLFGYSDTWQLVINTGTTIVTFLMVFLIQSTQNKDTQALQIKLDELIRATKGARNLLIDLEQLDDEQIERLRGTYKKMGIDARSGSKSK
ncbi:MAG TPA: low affinity iron permease family protein [Candidatus Binatia bacterium]